MDSAYPAWVLGPLFETISPIPRWIKSVRAKLCQTPVASKDPVKNNGSRRKGRSESVRAKSCPNAVAPWSRHVQREQHPAARRLDVAYRTIRRGYAGMVRRARRRERLRGLVVKAPPARLLAFLDAALPEGGAS